MAKKKKSAEDIIYQIKDLLDDLELQVNQDDNWDDDEDLDEDVDLDDEDEDNE